MTVKYYPPSVIQTIGEANWGVPVHKGPVLATAWGAQAVYPLFTVVNGRVIIKQIIGEVTTALSNNATLVKYYFTPTGGSQIDLSAISLTIAELAVGKRIMAAGTIGGATTFSGIGATMLQTVPYVLGLVGVGGVIGIESTTASLTSGAMKFTVLYTPLDDGAYILPT